MLTDAVSHKSIIAYLSANGAPDAAAATRAELGLGLDVFDEASTKKYETLLEKKWTGVVRLQKKVRPFGLGHLPFTPRGRPNLPRVIDYGPRIPGRGVAI
jgi:hypothetical protein